MSDTLRVNCQHLYRVAQAVNYIRDGNLCLLPLEYLTCVECKKTFVMDPIGGRISEHPSKDSETVFAWYSAQADKARESKIVQPTEKEKSIILS